MLCPKCKTEMRVQTHFSIQGDKSADTPTKLFLVQEFYCRNKSCPDYDKLVTTVQNPQDVQ